jgi:undecaprenyl-diphosphatase
VPAILVAVVLGIVEGLTEFVPVSSTGHLILVSHLLGFDGDRASAFDVAIQGGAVVAVLWCFRARFLAFLRPPDGGNLGGTRGLLLVAAATAPALLVGFFLRHAVKPLFAPVPVALALVAGALLMLAVERLRRRRGGRPADSIDLRAAVGVGLFQCLALWPGFSRSAATIAGGMALGLSRAAAAEFSFLVAAPTLLAASGYKLWTVRDSLSGDVALFFAVGALVSTLSAILAIRGFLALLSRWTLVPFAWYRVALAAVVLAVMLS